MTHGCRPDHLALQNALDLHRLPRGPARHADAALVQRLRDPAERYDTRGPDLGDDGREVGDTIRRLLDAHLAADLPAPVARRPAGCPSRLLAVLDERLRGFRHQGGV
jgi:hypothetical protein